MMYIHFVMNLAIIANIEKQLGITMATACARHMLVKTELSIGTIDEITKGADFGGLAKKVQAFRQLKKAETKVNLRKAK